MDSCAVDIGDVRIGIRTNTPSSSDALADAFAAYGVEDPDARRNFSVEFSREPNRAHLLFWGGCVAARSFDPRRIVRALCDHVAAHLAPPAGLVWVDSRAFVGGGRAVLMPTPIADDLRLIDRQTRAAGYLAVDSPRALVDFATGELVVDDLLDLDEHTLERVAAHAPRRREEPTVERGRYPIDRWVFMDYAMRGAQVSRARAARAAVLEILSGIEAPDEDLVRAATRLFERTQAAAMFPDYPASAFDSLVGRPRPD